MMRIRKMLRALTGIFLLTGCVNVKPFDRDRLADYTMRLDRNPATQRAVGGRLSDAGAMGTLPNPTMPSAEGKGEMKLEHEHEPAKK